MKRDAAYQLRVQMNAADALKTQLLSMTDDGDTIRDTIEGETSLFEMIDAVNVSMIQDNVIVDGCKAQIDILKTRKDRAEKAIKTKRAMIEQAMSIAGVDKGIFGTATITLRQTPPKLEITEESDIPLEYWKPAPRPDPVLDEKRLLEDLREIAGLIQNGEKPGREIPGVTLDNGGVSLTIRQK